MSNSVPGTSDRIAIHLRGHRSGELDYGHPYGAGPEHPRVGLAALRANDWNFWAAVAWEQRVKARPTGLHHVNARRLRSRWRLRHQEFRVGPEWPADDEYYRRRIK